MINESVIFLGAHGQTAQTGMMADRTGLGLIGCRSIWLPARQIQMHWPRSVNATAAGGGPNSGVAGGQVRGSKALTHVRLKRYTKLDHRRPQRSSINRQTDIPCHPISTHTIPYHTIPSWVSEIMAGLPFCIFAFVMKLKTRMNRNLFEIEQKQPVEVPVSRTRNKINSGSALKLHCRMFKVVWDKIVAEDEDDDEVGRARYE